MNKLSYILGTKYPIIQGAMQYLADPNLVSAVSNAGGLGVLSSGGLSVEELRNRIVETKQLTSRPFAVNINLQYKNVPELVNVIIDENISIVTTGAGTPKKYIPALKENNVKVIPVVPNLKIAQKMEKLGVDAVIAEGMESGAHIGTMASSVLWQLVSHNLSIPVIAAGGICNKYGVRAALDLGAEGIQCGTIFSICPESPVGDNWRKAVIDDNSQTITLGNPATRVLVNNQANKLVKLNLKQDELNDELEKGFLLALKNDDVDNGIIFAGQDVSLIDDVKSAEEIIKELAEEIRCKNLM